MCLYERYSKVRIVNFLSHAFPIQNGLKQGNALSLPEKEPPVSIG